MCGIVGLVSKNQNGFWQADVNLFTQMLVADSVRGVDGTGVFGTYDSGSVAWCKVGSHPYALLNSKKFEAFSQAMTRTMNIVVGHNRKGTSGNKSNENSHPFIHEHIILVHNGSIINHKEMAETEVDSHAIAHGIANNGYIETLKNLQGAFALVWFDMKERMLYLIRNSERPLSIVEGASDIAFASEGYMLRWISERNNKTWKDIKIVPEGTLISISQITKEITYTPLELYKPKPFHSPYYGGVYNHTWEGWKPDEDTASNEDPVASTIQGDMYELEEGAAVLGEEEAITLAFVNKYKEGQVITFTPTKIVPWQSASPQIQGYNLYGVLRDDNTVEVMASFDGIDKKNVVANLCNKKILSGTIFGVLVSPNTGEKSLQVNYVTHLTSYRTFNGTILTSDEWIAIADRTLCNRCNAHILIKDVGQTSVNIKSPKNIRVFCIDCVKKHYNKLPPEQRDAIDKINKQAAENNVLDLTQKEYNLKGATHGS